MSAVTNSRMDPLTLSRYLRETAEQENTDRLILNDLGEIIRAIGVAGKFISHKVEASTIEGTYAEQGGTNKTGDSQKALDIIANDVMINSLRRCGKVQFMVSEENEEIITISEDVLSGDSKYSVVFDPLDGSSNIECSVAVGTIFGIYPCQSVETGSPISSVLRPGKEMLAAGYILYSTSTIMVMSLGRKHGVRAFTMDASYGEFVEYPQSPVSIPAKPKRVISGNTGNAEIWNLPTSEFVRWTRRQKERYSLRYIGSMVADVHRTLLYGGIFMYPADFHHREGKLRMLYECFPMAFLAEAAGGQAINGTTRILDLVPQGIHQRVPIYLGCNRDVSKVEQLFRRIPHLYSMHCAPITTRLITSPTSHIQNTPSKITTSKTSSTESPDKKRLRSANSQFWELEMKRYTLTERYVGDEDNFELSGVKGSLFQELVRMNDPEWTLATECDTGNRGLLPTRLLVPTHSEIMHKVATTNYDADGAEDTVDFQAGDAALKVRYMSDERWCYAVNARTGLSGIVPTSIFAN